MENSHNFRKQAQNDNHCLTLEHHARKMSHVPNEMRWTVGQHLMDVGLTWYRYSENILVFFIRKRIDHYKKQTTKK